MVGFSLQHFSVILEPGCSLSLVALKEGLGTHGGSQLLINSRFREGYHAQCCLIYTVSSGPARETQWDPIKDQITVTKNNPITFLLNLVYIHLTSISQFGHSSILVTVYKTSSKSLFVYLSHSCLFFPQTGWSHSVGLNSVCRPDCPWTDRDSLVPPAFPVLGLKKGMDHHN